MLLKVVLYGEQECFCSNWTNTCNSFLLLSVGFAAFAANVIQFGIDQLQDLPAKSSFLFHTLVPPGNLCWS